jgi:UTP--glucose-1-phosphate uridylyltransferase
MLEIKKVVIPVAGLGTRMLPATKAQPKEMLPIVDKPVIQYIVEEAVRAGFKDIVLVTGATKRPIEDHFDRNEHLESFLLSAGKKDACEQIKEIANLANFIYLRQKGPYGNGTPVMNARQVIGNEPFAVVWGDDVWTCKVPHLKQLSKVFQKYQDPVITARMTDAEGTKKYAIIDGVEVEPGVFQVKSIVEKPGPQKAKTRIAALGGYIFTPDIFDELDQTPLGKGNELWLVDAISRLLKKRPVYAKIIDGEIHDTGSKLGLLKANVSFGLNDPEIKKQFKQFIKSL